MKRALLAGALAGLLVGGSLGLAACQDPAPRHKVVRAKHTVHKMSDGRYAFQGDNGLWYWYVYSTSGTPRLDDGTLATPGSWTVGGAPDTDDLMSGVDVDIDIPTLDGGAPISESQAASVEASAEAGGGMSEASAGPTDSSPSVDSSVDSGASSGGDSGGGGGDGGGGGGGD